MFKGPTNQPSLPESEASKPTAPEKPSSKKLVIIVIVVVVGLVVLGVASALIYKSLNKKKDIVLVNQEPDNANQNVNAPPSSDLDSDRDGLTDEEEKLLGTDPTEPDTDRDGLFDNEEVNDYKTDPLKYDTDGDKLTDKEEIKIYKTDVFNPDTDGDGYLDGIEVLKGFNPLGEGRL